MRVRGVRPLNRQVVGFDGRVPSRYTGRQFTSCGRFASLENLLTYKIYMEVKND